MANPLKAALKLQKGARSATAFAGAQTSRLTTDWALAVLRSADQEVRWDLQRLRRNSRELVRNTGHGSRFIELLGDNVIGANGIRFQATNRLEDGSIDRKSNRLIESAFERWGDVGICTADGRSSWIDVQTQIVSSWAEDGEILVRLLPGFDNEFGFAVQLIDADHLDETFNIARSSRHNEVRMGVEVNEWSRPVAYHVWDRHPYDFQSVHRKRLRIPAEQIIHVFRPNRVGQTRGVPRLSPVMLAIHMLHGYEEAELVAARIASAKGGFFVRDGQAIMDPDKEAASLSMDVEPGVFEALPPGWKYAALDPQHPTSAFGDFRKGMLQSVAAGAGISYPIFANDLEGVSFSSIRAGTLADRDAYRRLQWFIVRRLRPIFMEWLRWSLTVGALPLSVRNTAVWSSHRWQPRGWDWVDPEKELKAKAMELRLNLNSPQRIAAERGMDLEEIYDEIEEAKRMAEERGLEFTTDISRSGGGVSTANPAPDALDLTAPSRNDHNRIASVLNGNGKHG